MDLDHVAIATADARAALEVLVGEWGGVDLWGGLGVGFRPMQVQLGADGMRLELLEPWNTDRFDFLARFLERHGDGPHHMTFKVKDLAAELDRLGGLGYSLVNVNLDDPHWKEAFFMPKDAHGTVVQVAQASHTPEEIQAADPDGSFVERWWLPVPRRPDGVDVTLRRVVLGAPDVGAAAAFFSDVLGGASEDAAGGGASELTWPGGGRVRIEPRPDQPGGIDRIECESNSITGDFVVAGARFRLSRA